MVLTGGRLKTTTGAATDLDGYYVIPNLPPGTYRIKVSYIGYRDYEQNVEVTAETGPRIEIHVELEWEAIRLQEYVITASRGKREKLTDAPAAMSVITSSEIRRGSNPNLGDYFKHVKGVDFTASGIDGFNLSARGFNTSFSSRLLTLTDGRKANVPSLRLIAYNTIPTTSDDVDQIEVVLGPSSALYGPNAYSGVANIITKKPRVSTGTTAGLSIGNRDYLKLQARHAGVLGKLGYKISLVNFRATDWRWVDPEEAKGHHKFWIEDDGEIGALLDDGEYPTAEDPWDWKWDGYNIRFDRDGDGDFCGEADTVFLGADYIRADRNSDGLIDTADFAVKNLRFDIRLDYDFGPDHSLIASLGQAIATNLNITGIARFLAKGWTYRYYQARYVKGNFFIQTYLNTSNAGKTRNLRTAARIYDESTFFHLQTQHTIHLPRFADTRLTYGFDYQRTMPKTFGTILPDGKAGKSYDNDGVDNDGDGKVDEFAEGLITTNEYGLYFQSTSPLGHNLELILASRLDLHDGVLDDHGFKFLKDPLLGSTVAYRPQYSPKLGLLWKPIENQTFRLTAARAFNPPSSQGLYLDMVAGINPPFLVKARGNHAGYRYTRDAKGTLMMWDVRAGSYAEFMLAQVPDSAVLYIPAVLGRPSQFVQQENIQALEPVTSELVWTYELGYAGIIANRMRATLDIYYSKYSDFVSDLTWITPIVLDTTRGLDNAEVIGIIGTGEFDGVKDGGDGIPGSYRVEYGSDQWNQLPPINWNQPPKGTRLILNAPGDTSGAYYTDDQVDFDNPIELALSNINYGTVYIGGVDMSLAYFFSPQLLGEIRFSYLGQQAFYNHLTDSDDPVNAPRYKVSGSVTYNSRKWWAGLTGRHIPEFDWSAGVFYGTIASYTVFDLSTGYRFGDTYTLKLNISNLNNDVHREIIGGAELGRQIILNWSMDLSRQGRTRL